MTAIPEKLQANVRSRESPFAHSNDVDQSNRFDADQIGAKRRKALSV